MNVARQRKIARGAHISAASFTLIGRGHFTMLQAHRVGRNLDGSWNRRRANERVSGFVRDASQTHPSAVKTRKSAGIAQRRRAACACRNGRYLRVFHADRAGFHWRCRNHWRFFNRHLRKKHLILAAMNGAPGNLSIRHFQRPHTLRTNHSHKRLTNVVRRMGHSADRKQHEQNHAYDADNCRGRSFAGAGQLRVQFDHFFRLLCF